VPLSALPGTGREPELAAVRWICQDLDLARHAGVEGDLTSHLYGSAEGLAVEAPNRNVKVGCDLANVRRPAVSAPRLFRELAASASDERSRGPWAAIALAAVALMAGALMAGAPVTAEVGPAPTGPTGLSEPIVPIPVSRAVDPKRVALGEQLFQDVRLSRDQGRSCATCHALEQGGMDGRVRAITADGTPHPRNTPTIFNVGLSSFFNWDGIADTLEGHTEFVLHNPRLMGITWPELLDRLGADEGYVSRFRAAYPGGLTRPNVVDALVTFERSLETPDSRFDRYLRGERDALTEAERRGYQLFKSYGCVTCHQGINIGANMFQKFFAVFPDRNVQDPDADLGRYQVTRVPRDRGVFRVPSLRNVAVTGPYFHDGRALTLEVAVDTMARVQLGRALRPEEIDLIVQFLNTLTGRYRGRSIDPASPLER
jgi:cytochrome c peroxidase